MKKMSYMVMAAIWMAAYLFISTLTVTAATWDGGGSDDNWSSNGNWGGTTPVAGDPLVFAGSVRATNVNDTVADTSYSGITFNSGSALFSLSGNRITLGGNVVNNDDSTHQMNLDMILNATRLFTLNAGGLYLNGLISGSGGITSKGDTARTLVLTGANTYQGPTTVDGSHIRIQHAKALGTTDNGIQVNDSRRLEISGGIAVTGETAVIFGGGGNYNGAIQSISGHNTWAGAIILGSSGARLGTTTPSGSLTVSGVIDDGANTYNLAIRSKDDCGPVILTSTNTYGGETQVIVGTLKLDGGDNRLPTNTVVRVGNSSNVNLAEWDLNGWNQLIKGLTDDGTTMVRKVLNSSATFSTLTISNPSPYTYEGYLSGHINLTKGGSGTLTLDTKPTVFDGTTVVEGGTLALGDAMSIGNSTYDTGDGLMGTLSFTDNTEINFGGLIGTNNLTLTNELGQSISLRIRGVQNSVFDGQILEGVNFTKTGVGTFTMMQPSTFTGKASIEAGTLYLPTEESLGLYPASFVQDQITFDGGRIRADTNYLFAANNRGVTLAAGGAGFYMVSPDGILTVEKNLVGSGGVIADGSGVVLLVASNSYDGVTAVNSSVLRITDNAALGSVNGGTVVNSGGQLELADGMVINGETISLSGAGITGTIRPPSSPTDNRGALQAAVDATAEWAGPILLVATTPRAGAQNGGHLIISGNISDAAGPIQFRTSSNPWDKERGVELRGFNTYLGNTDITRGTLFMGATNTLPAGSVLDVHWAGSNNGEYGGLDLKGFDQRIAGLMNSGNTGDNAAIVNTATRPAVLTVDQDIDTSYRGTIKNTVALVKEGSGNLTLAFPTTHTGSTTVSEGTLTLGTNGVLSANSPVILSGGTLDIGSTTNTLSTLSVTAPSTLELGTGEISFGSQSSAVWSGQLNLTGTLGPATLRFVPSLTNSQLALIRYEGKAVSQSAAGYIKEIYGTMIIIL